jgi:hypothetical protein
MHHRSGLDPNLVEQLVQAELDRDSAAPTSTHAS